MKYNVYEFLTDVNLFKHYKSFGIMQRINFKHYIKNYHKPFKDSLK